jgi:hypothetical protein
MAFSTIVRIAGAGTNELPENPAQLTPLGHEEIFLNRRGG